MGMDHSDAPAIRPSGVGVRMVRNSKQRHEEPEAINSNGKQKFEILGHLS